MLCAVGAGVCATPWAVGTSSREADDLALQVVKYQQRDGWSHGDLLRLAHPKAPEP